MNTPRSPREILLARHAATRPALDAQRDALLSRFAAEPAPSTSAAPASPRATASFSPLTALRDFFGVLHRELFAPYRRAWTALAAVWIALLGFQRFERLATSPFAADRTAKSAPSVDAPLLALWLEQRRQLAADPSFHTAPAPGREKPSEPSAARPLGAVRPARDRTAFV